MLGNQNQFFESAIFQSTGQEVNIQFLHMVTGGCINQTVHLQSNKGHFFLKWNELNSLHNFQQEAKGLDLLRANTDLTVPEVLGYDQLENKAYLLLSYIDSYPTKPNYWEHFGQSLAQLHKQSHDYFGLDFDNYIGSLPQKNAQESDWLSFFIENRLRVQFGLAYYNGLIDQHYLKKLDQLAAKLDGFFPEEAPALLHGDLWSGNALVDHDGTPALVDPAVYYGHREMELAFTKLFGGFPETFYAAYHEAYPIAPGFEQRKAIYNCYPLMVHVNLFGKSYLSGIDRVFDALL
ncbi:MAG: fructosamine kinase family protein [Flammeovirgaceae bacterium]